MLKFTIKDFVFRQFFNTNFPKKTYSIGQKNGSNAGDKKWKAEEKDNNYWMIIDNIGHCVN